MRSLKWMAVPALFLASIALGQNPPEKKSPPEKSDKPAEKADAKKPSLEELLGLALQHSPEVQVAEAKLKEAEALLRQTKLQIAQRVIEVRNKAEEQHQALETADAEYKRISMLVSRGVASQSETTKVQAQIQALKSRIAEMESNLSALTGRLPALNRVEGGAGAPGGVHGIGFVGGGAGMGLGGGHGGLPDRPDMRWPRQAMADKMFKALEKPVSKLDKLDQVPLKDVIDYVREQSKDVPILAKLNAQAEETININFKGDLTLGAYFQILLDTVPDLRIVTRDYGFLITFAGSDPDDGLGVVQFWQEYQMRFNSGA